MDRTRAREKLEQDKGENMTTKIIEKFPEIKLLYGSHEDTGTTGQGCFMNVIAYLNGEEVITDKSECVCPMVRPIAVWLNDYCLDSQRGKLLPFILRALGSKTSDPNENKRRLSLVVDFAKNASGIAKAVAREAERAAAAAAREAERAAAAAAPEAERAAAAAAWAVCSAPAPEAERAASAAAEAVGSWGFREDLLRLGIEFLDNVLPPLCGVQEDTQKRIYELAEMHKVEI